MEMETGTGKTYCYIKTIFEMNKSYGWSKFIIVVPSIAIREGVCKSLQITADHFLDAYSKRAKFFIYNSRTGLHNLESFSSDSGINIMVINIQAFNASGKDNRRIYEELDDFQSRRPIDVISANRPILILDEPQKMEGDKTIESLAKFKPLMVLRYSATHKTNHNQIYRLDALDAYREKLVKKIAVRGISVKGLKGSHSYLYLERIEVSTKAPPVAYIELEIKQKKGIERITRKLKHRDNLFGISRDLNQYKGYVISQIDAVKDTVEFTNGEILTVGDARGNINEETLRRIQIRETIKAHLDKEEQLFSQGIKVLSLFFIDEVVRYRDYDAEDTKGLYARMFEEEYALQIKEKLKELQLPLNEQYHDYLKNITVQDTHKGYFSIDKKGKMVDSVKSAKSERAESTDVDAYDLILKDKETLLSYPTEKDCPESVARKNVRFIFSHSALREGWDNPNVFVMCMLKQSDNTISRRQEVGRGLRISVNQRGERQDQSATVHETNVLSVITSESYTDFIKGLQTEIADSLAARPRKASKNYFLGKQLKTEKGPVTVSEVMANKIHQYLEENNFVDHHDEITPAYHQAKTEGALPALPEALQSYSEPVFQLIDSVFSNDQLPDITNDRATKKNPLNIENFHKKEFQALWEKINKRAVYKVDFDSGELTKHCIRVINENLSVTELNYHIEAGEQQTGFEFKNTEKRRNKYNGTIFSQVNGERDYDLIGKIAEATVLTRKTAATILKGIAADKFACFKKNPEQFIAEISQLITDQKAGIIIEGLTYDETGDEFKAADIFTASQSRQDRATEALKRHIYKYAITDSKVEREFVKSLDVSEEIVVYAKLPGDFFIPTPVGRYNPDWAISFKEGTVKYVYFIAETKGSMSSLELRGTEKHKIDCARKFFAKITAANAADKVKYDVVTDYDKLMEVVGKPHAA
ncbi:MAG: DEAD/DEAH box helicase family protein [Endozoicomonadaceae bacterium]|nr:DEAD/DEAH box helicase family protein [Endozoicomonadaceae bacterium]